MSSTRGSSFAEDPFDIGPNIIRIKELVFPKIVFIRNNSSQLMKFTVEPKRTDRITVKPCTGDVSPGMIALVKVFLLNDSKKGEDLEDATLQVQLFDPTGLKPNPKPKFITIQYTNEDEEQSFPNSIKEHIAANQKGGADISAGKPPLGKGSPSPGRQVKKDLSPAGNLVRKVSSTSSTAKSLSRAQNALKPKQRENDDEQLASSNLHVLVVSVVLLLVLIILNVFL